MKAELWFGSPVWKPLRAAQATRARKALTRLPKGALPQSDAARRFWSQRTWSEFAAVPAVAQVVLALTRQNVEPETVAVYAAIAADEARHAELSAELAERLGGYDDEVPEGLIWAPRSLAAASTVPATTWLVANGCFSETVSLELIRARAQVTRQPLVRAVLLETLRDETVHVKAAWHLAAELLPWLAHAQLWELHAYGLELAQMLKGTFGTSALPPGPRRRERALREETHAQGLGALAPDDADAIVERTLEEIFARLAKLGVKPRRA